MSFNSEISWDIHTGKYYSAIKKNELLKYWRRKWQPTPVFLPGECHGQRSLAGYVHGVARVRHNLVTKEREREVEIQLG